MNAGIGKRKRKRVPEVLWRVFKNEARCLSETIISLIPQHCDCHSKGICLRCVFLDDDEAAMSYLVRPSDPLEYHHLMNTCFVVVPSHAPPLPPLVSFSLRWSQLQIVERVIETLLRKQDATGNLICNGFQKSKSSSSIVKVLTYSAWDLVLKRVGDSLMDYLLMHTLIFISIRPNGHQQIAGPPINELLAKIPAHIPDCESSNKRRRRKRRRGGKNDKISDEFSSNTSHVCGPQKSLDYDGSRNEVYSGKHHSDENSLLHYIEAAKLGKDYGLYKEDMLEERTNKEVKIKPGKRLRLLSWQRRKRDQSKDDMIPTSDKNMDLDESNLNSKLAPSLCPCCSVFQSLSPVKDVQINRKPIFYSMERSSSVFLNKHALYSVKPGFTGAAYLLGNVLGLPNTDRLRLPASRSCSHGPACLYHSHVKLLKGLLHRVKQCQHKRLLKKHCSSQPSSSIADKEPGFRHQSMSHKLEAEVASFTCDKQVMNYKTDQPVKRSSHPEVWGCKSSEITQCHFGLKQPYCLKDEVVSFVWAVCRNIVPPDLLGVPSTRRILRRNIARFIKLRRFEKFSLKQCIHKLEISKFPHLSKNLSFNCFNVSAMKDGSQLQNKSHFSVKQAIIERWIFWLFTNIVVPLVQAHFYVTDAEHGKQNIYYYHKAVWKKLSDTVITKLKDQNYYSLDCASVHSILKERSFGFSKVRLSPKETGARPIANLKAPSRFDSRGFGSQAQHQHKKRKRQSNKTRKASYLKAVNTVLRDVHAVFKDLRIKEPEHWGLSVSCYNDIYRKLCPFLRNLKEGKVGTPAVYIVVSDVEKAFDTVDQDKLLSILSDIEMADKYTLQQSYEIFCRKKFLWVSKNQQLAMQNVDSRCVDKMASCLRKSHHTVIINLEHSFVVKKKDLEFILTEHLKHNVLKIGQRFFLQNVGIPQGSVLSSLLCSLYYRHLERNVISPLLVKGATDIVVQEANVASALETTKNSNSSSPKYLLLRFVDDFLLLSTSKKQAGSFLSRLQRGFREYNCYMNNDKIGTNFNGVHFSGCESKRIFIGSDGTSFICWSGLLVNCCSLEVQADYTRYMNDHLLSSLTVSWQGGPGHQLKAKLCAYMRPKCHPIFFDTIINSLATIRLNVYQAFLLCAMKFHCYVRELSTWFQLRPRSCLLSIEGSLRYMYSLMKRRMYGINHGANPPSVLKVTKEEVIWLGLTAYIRVLNRKQSRYKELLCSLRARLKPLSSIGGCSDLKYAVDDSHSTLLWKIKY